MMRTGQANLHNEREAVATAGINDTAPVKLSILENAIAQGEYKANVDVPIVMTDSEKTQSINEWRTYRERNDQLKKHRG